MFIPTKTYVLDIFLLDTSLFYSMEITMFYREFKSITKGGSVNCEHSSHKLPDTTDTTHLKGKEEIGFSIKE